MTITYLQSVPGAPVAEKQTKDARPGLESLFNIASTRVWGAAYDMVSPVAMAVRQAARQSYRDDEPFPFLITEEHFKKLSDGVDPAYWDRFENVENEQSAQAVRAEALQLTKDRRILAEAGYGGMAATIGATFLDPAQLSIMLLTGASGTTKTTIDAARAARVASMAEQGLVLYTPRTLGFVGSVSVGSAEVSAFSQVASRAKSLGILGDTEIEYVVNAIRNGASAQQVRAATVAVMQQVIKKQPALAGGIEANAADEIARQIAIQITGKAGSSASTASSVASAAATATAAALKPHDWLRTALLNAVPQAAVSLYQAQQQPEDFATTDTASQFAGDFAFGAASSLTRGASVWRRAVAGALAQGSPTLALDAVISDKDGTEMMGAWALNSLLGGAFNAMNVGSKLSRDIDDAAKNTIKRVQAETARQQGVDLTVKGQKALEAPDYVGRFIEGEAADFDAPDLPPSPTGTPPSADTPKTKKGPSFGIGTAGADDPAFRQPKTRDNWKVGDFDATHADEENGFLSGLEKFSNKYLRLAPIARVMNSDIRELRYVASMFMTDPTKNYAGMAAQVDQARASFRKKYYPLYEKLETEARKANPSMTGEQFREEVTKTIRRINTLTVDPNNPIHKAALEHIRLRDELVDIAARHGVPWSYEMEVGPDGKKTPKPRFRSKEDSNYMPIMAKRAVIDAILSGKSEFGSLGSEKIRELVGEAVFKAMKMDLTDPDDVARARRASGLLADRWLSNVGTHNEAMAAAETRLFSLDDRAEVVEILKGAGVHSDNIEAILFGMGPKKQAEGKNPFKRRMPLDVTHGIEWVDGSGITKRLSIEDLLVNDAMVLTHRYADAVLSQSAFAEGMRVFAQKYDIAEPPQTIGDLMGYLGKATGRADDPNLERIRFAVNATLGGTPPEYFLKRRGKMFAASRALRNAQQLALLGNVTAGVQNFSNIAHVLGSAGWDTTIRLFPVLPEIAKATWNGKAPPAGIIRMVTDLGIGVHSITDRVMPYVSMEDGIAGQVGWMENATMKAAHFSHRASGQRWTTDLSEILAGASMSEKLFRAAQSGKPLGTKLLASLGIDSEMGERIASQIRKHGYGTDVKTGEFNLRKWDDLQAAATAQNSIIAFTRRVSWQPDVTELSGVMASEEMKLFFQMRRFGLTAYEHAFVPLVKRIGKNPMDMGAWSMFVQASIVGSLGYVVNSWIQSVGRPDADQYLKRKLAPEEVAKASFSRAIWSGLLPAVADTALLGLGKEAQFAGQRITLSDPGEGIAGIWNSNPTGDTLSAWARSTSGIGRTFHDPSYHFSVQDMRNIERGLFIPNTLNLRTWIERAAAAMGVPEKSISSYN